MVEFLLDAPAALIESITGQAHDMEGIHDRPRAGEFFSGCAFEPGESIHRDDLNAFAPGVGLGGQPGFEDLLGAARDHVQEPGGTATVSYGSDVQDDGDVFVSVGGVAPHVFIHANDTHAFTPCWIIDQQARPSARTAVLAVFQDTPRAWATRATVRWWTTRPVSAQRTAARESFARGSAA